MRPTDVFLRYARHLTVGLMCVLAFAAHTPALAQTTNPAPTANRYHFVDPLGQRSVPEIIGAVIRFALGFVGALFLVYFLYGGFVWMTAGGNDKKVAQSRAILKNAVLGIAVVMLSYTALSLLLNFTSAFLTG